MSAEDKKDTEEGDKNPEPPYQPWDITQPTGHGITENQRKAKIYNAFQRMKEAPSVDAMELARLLLLSNGGKLKDFEGKEIDPFIDLVAKCQWRLELAKEGWEARAAKLWREVDSEPEPSETIKKIRSFDQKSNIPFQKGLITLGVPATGKKKTGENREANFFPFFENWHICNHYFSFLYGTNGDEVGEGGIRIGQARNPEDWVKPSGSEIRSEYKKLQKRGWTPRSLEDISEAYDEYKSELIRQQKSKAGKKSAIARKPSNKKSR